MSFRFHIFSFSCNIFNILYISLVIPCNFAQINMQCNYVILVDGKEYHTILVDSCALIESDDVKDPQFWFQV